MLKDILNSSYFVMPASLFVIELMFILLKFLDETSSFSKMVPTPWLVIPAIIVCGLDFAALGLFNWFLCRVVKNKKIQIPIFTTFCIYMLFSLVVCIVDLINRKETLQQNTQYYFTTYDFGIKSMFDDSMSIEGLPQVNGNSKMIGNIMKRSPGPWTAIFVTLSLVIAFQIFWGITNCQKNRKRAPSKPSPNSSSAASSNISSNITASTMLDSQIETVQFVSKKPKANQKLKIITMSAIMVVWFTELVLFIVCMCSDDKTLQLVVPNYWNFYQSHRKTSMSHKEVAQATQFFRSNNELKEGYDWIDQRANPQFPMVYAPKKTVCSYNPELEYCKTLQADEPKAPQELPNVVIVIAESFTPGPMMYQNNVVTSNEKIVDGPLYKKNYLPNLNKLSEDALTFASLSASGIPTLYGWLSLMTGEIPYSNSINIVQSMLNDVDDFPSYFHSNNYQTMYVAPCKFKFDGQHNWLFRGRKVAQPQYKALKEMPKWFDNIYQYIPTKEQAEQLGVEQNKMQSWVPDRITAKQFITHFEENSKAGKPTLGVWATVDTHMSFQGYDNDEFYEPVKFGKGRHGNQKMSEQIDRYATVAKYMDKYIGEVVDYLKEKHNNTIFVVVGDHGAREVPQFTDNIIDKLDPQSQKYDNSCNHKQFSNDQLYVTSALITYLGDNPLLRSKFDPLRSKVVKVPTDHHDLIKTVYELVEDQNNIYLASSRNGRNLLELATNLTQNKPLRKHWSLRTTMLHSEVATENTVYRYHTKGPYGEKFEGIYPTCVRPGEKRAKITKKEFDSFSQYHKFYDYIQRGNRQFSYKFRNPDCQYPKVCNFPVNYEAYNRNDALILGASAVGVGVGAGVVFMLIYWVYEIIMNKKKKYTPIQPVQTY
ncbi:Sulfatase [Hexamita inflata]|uniref:Sulfatase n=1 Tax=Hexamita inflata TaxID=28002 RepID=A0AA86V5H4_9EUKA|nr:Sulfatase [Hexamita inflata]